MHDKDKSGLKLKSFMETTTIFIMVMDLKTIQWTFKLSLCIQFPFCICQGLAIQNLSFLDELEGLYFKLFGELLAVPFLQLERERGIWGAPARVSRSPLVQEEKFTPF